MVNRSAGFYTSSKEKVKGKKGSSGVSTGNSPVTLRLSKGDLYEPNDIP
jgi:hypothetical protein